MKKVDLNKPLKIHVKGVGVKSNEPCKGDNFDTDMATLYEQKGKYFQPTHLKDTFKECPPAQNWHKTWSVHGMPRDYFGICSRCKSVLRRPKWEHICDLMEKDNGGNNH